MAFKSIFAAVLLLSQFCGTLGQGALDLYPPSSWSVRAFSDNFDISNKATFKQRVLSFDKWWSSGGPILLYLGNEGPIETLYNFTGAMFEHAQALQAMVVFVEHRFYGKSIPSSNSGMDDPKNLRGLTVDQAMADFAWFVPKMKQRFGCGPSNCPVITFGGSYGGMLVAWFRQKYPQLTVGGVAAGAPVDFYPGDGRQAAFWSAVLHTFDRFGSPACASSLDKVLKAVKSAAETTAGRELLGRQLGSCDDLRDETTAGAKVDFFSRGVLASLAMLDYTEASTFIVKLPANPVEAACTLLQHTSDATSGLRAVLDLYQNGTGTFRCYDFMAEMVGRPTLGQLKGPITPPDMGPWQYQACNELVLETLTNDGFGFYPASDEQVDEVSAACNLRYNVTPRSNWLKLSLGGSDLRVGGLLFTDGEKDPWHTGKVKPEVLQPGLDITHYLIPGAAHHEDLRFDSKRPRPEVQKAKRLARATMQKWIDRPLLQTVHV